MTDDLIPEEVVDDVTMHEATLDEIVSDATVRWDAFAGVYTVYRNGAVVRIKPGSRDATVNGKPLKLSVPVVLRKGQPFVSEEFFNEVFQSGLDQTFRIETTASGINRIDMGG